MYKIKNTRLFSESRISIYTKYFIVPNFMSDNKKQMMDIQKVKSLSVAVSDEHQRNWDDDLFSRKENDPKYNYDRSRTRLNFQVSKGGELGPIDNNRQNRASHQEQSDRQSECHIKPFREHCLWG
jgi:hypothetical protein